MKKEERILRLIERKDIDFLPSHITFSDNTRHKNISESLGLSSENELEDYLQNHLLLSFVKDDIPIFYRNDAEYMLEMQKQGYCKVDIENKIVYDRFGMGINMYHDTIFILYSPLEGNKEKNKKAEGFLPEDIRKVINLPLEEAIKKYNCPDPLREDNLDIMKKDLEENKGNFMVIPTGYFGIFERAYNLIGFENFMTEIVLHPNLIHGFLEKITDYKIALAKEKLKLPFKIQHHSDDLGSQRSVLFSPKMFKEIIKPYLKKLFQVYKDQGCYVCMHSCGYIMDYIPDLIEIGLDIIEPVQTCNDINRLKKEFGKDLIFWGGIETQKLPFISPEETKEMVKDVIHTLGKNGGLIIAPAQHITRDVPIENIKVLIETIVEERDMVF